MRDAFKRLLPFLGVTTITVVLCYAIGGIKSAGFALLSCVGGFLFGMALAKLTYKLLDTQD